MRGALGLVNLAFDLKAGFPCEVADGVLYGALGFISCALDMFVIMYFSIVSL